MGSAPVTAEQVLKGTCNNPVLSRVMEIIMRGKGESDDLEVKWFLSQHHEFSVWEGE